MKKFIVALICLLPAAGYAQTVIKQIWLPNLTTDSTTKLRTLQIAQNVPGAKNEKLTAVLSKWIGSNYTVVKGAKTTTDTTVTVINAEGVFNGSCPISRQQFDINATDKTSTRQTPIDYKIDFKVKLAVTAGKYAVTIDNLKLEYLNVVTPIEPLYDGNDPTVLIPADDAGMDIGEMYNHMFNDINLRLKDIAKSASKYIAKAQKKGDL